MTSYRVEYPVIIIRSNVYSIAIDKDEKVTKHNIL